MHPPSCVSLCFNFAFPCLYWERERERVLWSIPGDRKEMKWGGGYENQEWRFTAGYIYVHELNAELIGLPDSSFRDFFFLGSLFRVAISPPTSILPTFILLDCHRTFRSTRFPLLSSFTFIHTYSLSHEITSFLLIIAIMTRNIYSKRKWKIGHEVQIQQLYFSFVFSFRLSSECC